MSRISEDEGGLKAKDIELMKSKRIVFIVDEAHRSTFGEMLYTIKKTFPQAIFFGFTGTPIHEENEKNDSTTADVFGDELHRYSIADGIRDKNVLGFDIYKVLTFKDIDLRKMVALEKAKLLVKLKQFPIQINKQFIIHTLMMFRWRGIMMKLVTILKVLKIMLKLTIR